MDNGEECIYFSKGIFFIVSLTTSFFINHTDQKSFYIYANLSVVNRF